MEKGICHLAFIPLRKDPSDASEMISQLLFGETYDILEKNAKWFFVRNHFDSYEGWIYEFSVNHIENSIFTSLNKDAIILETTSMAVNTANKLKNFLLPTGSVLHSYNNGSFIFSNELYRLTPDIEIDFSQKKSDKIIDTAKGLINTPYMWGGRSGFGIDCSGLVQTCFRIAGINLPRDTYQQAEKGTTVYSPEESDKADVAFFVNEKGKISHTGILIDKNTIIHASVRVRIDKFDSQGIYNEELKKYTHQLLSIKRFI